MRIETVGVIGAGTMGNGIAQVFAAAGFPVVMQDLSKAALDRAMGTIRQNLGRQVKKGTLTETAAEAAAGRITTVTGVEAMADHALEAEDAVSEAVFAATAAIGKTPRVSRDSTASS